MNFIEQIADFAMATKYEDIPSELIEKGKIAVIDFVGVSIAGCQDDASRYAQEYVAEFKSAEMASIFGTDQKAHSALAAYCNGVASHVKDFDDCGETAINHPSATVLPAVFSVGEQLSANGQELLRAFLIGVEIQNKLGALALPNASAKGWHTTSVFGHFGSTIAASILLGSSREEIMRSIGIAASNASGMRGNFGSMTKPHHVGHASYSGINAAFLGKKGMTSSLNIIESEQGFIKLFSDQTTEYRDMRLGKPWDIVNPGFQIKMFPSCSASHPALEALFNIRKRVSFSVADLESIHTGIGLLGIKELPCHNPTTPDEARFSMEYAMAAGIVYGKVTVDEFEKEAINDPEIKKVMSRVTMDVDDELALLGLTADEPCKLTVTLKNGEVFKERCMLAKGQPGKPLTTDELKDKFLKCAEKIYTKDKGAEIFERLLSLDEMENMSDLMEIMK